MRALSKTIPVLVVAAAVLMVLAIPLSVQAKCKAYKSGTFTFRVHSVFYGADTDIKVEYCAVLRPDGTVSVLVSSVEADPWAYARLESKIVVNGCSAHNINVELVTKVLLNAVSQDVLDGELIPVYGPTQDIGEIHRDIPDISWDPQICPKIKSVLPQSAPVIFEGHTIPEHSYATRVKDVQGDVRIKSEGSGRFERPAPGAELKPGDTIETQEGEITFYTMAAKVKAGAKTLVRIVYDRTMPGPVKQCLSMVHGFLMARAKKEENSLKIATPNAICGVRGTNFKISHDQATTTTIVEVEDGVVAFSDPQNRKTVEVKAGMKSVIKGNGLPSDPVPIR